MDLRFLNKDNYYYSRVEVCIIYKGTLLHMSRTRSKVGREIKFEPTGNKDSPILPNHGKYCRLINKLVARTMKNYTMII